MTGATTYRISENVGVLGTSIKQNPDVRKFYFDFSRWLDSGEQLGALSNFAISIVAPAYGWQADFPFPTESSSLSDTTPLVMSGMSIVSPSMASISVSAGTPGLAYVTSFLARTNMGRTKEIDILVTVNAAVNSNMITSSAPSVLSITVVSATTALAAGTEGNVYVENSSSAPIIITLPPSPVQGQTLTIKDVTGNAGVYPITIIGAAGEFIDATTSLVIGSAYGAATLQWTGSKWSQVA